jgi:hypothetical protein
MIRRNSNSSYSIKLPDVNTRRHITVELVADMKHTTSLELIYKEYNTDVKEKKQQVAVSFVS